MLLELFEDGKDVFKRGKTKEWLRERIEKGMFFARYIRALEMMTMSSDQFAGILNAIEPDISKQR